MPDVIKTRVKPSEMRLDDDLDLTATPLAATPARGSQTTPAPRQMAIETVPLQPRFRKDIAKAIKHEAVDRDETIGEFLTFCYELYKHQKGTS